MKTSLRVALCAAFASMAVGIVVAADDSKSTPVPQKIPRPKPAALVPTVQVTAAVIQRGAQVYRENCAVCHGEDGRVAVDGHQYIAVSTGGNTHPEKTALSLHPEIKVTQGYNSLFVFRLRAAPDD